MAKRLVFGRDRLPETERWCPAWPESPDAKRKAAYTRWVKGAADQVTYRRCADCGGPFAFGDSKSAMHGRLGLAHGDVSKCVAYMTANPIGPEYGPTLGDLVKAAPPVMQPAIVAEDGGRPAPCPRCGRADFRTAVGRTWHLENNPDCSKYRRPDRHQYATA